MLLKLAAIIGLEFFERKGGNDLNWGPFIACLALHNGSVLEKQSKKFVAVFHNADDALRYSVELQRNSALTPDMLGLFRIAINHRDRGLTNRQLSSQEIDNISNLLGRAEDGGICLARTVYDTVRGRIKLKYNTTPDMSDAHYACAIMRQNEHKIDLLGNSSVHLARYALIWESRQDPAGSNLPSPIFQPIRIMQRWVSWVASH